MAIATELDVRPLSPLIGAEIHGLDLSRPLAASVVAGSLLGSLMLNPTTSYLGHSHFFGH